MVEDGRSERSGIGGEGSCAADVLQAGLLRWELHSCP